MRAEVGKAHTRAQGVVRHGYLKEHTNKDKNEVKFSLTFGKTIQGGLIKNCFVRF